MTPLLTGAIDVWPGYLINEVLAAKEKGFDVNIVYPSDYGIDLYADTLFTTETMLKEKPDVVRNFVAATLKGWNTAIAAPEEAAKDHRQIRRQAHLRARAGDDEGKRAVAQARQQTGRLHGHRRLELRAEAPARRRISRRSRSTSPRHSSRLRPQ